MRRSLNIRGNILMHLIDLKHPPRLFKPRPISGWGISYYMGASEQLFVCHMFCEHVDIALEIEDICFQYAWQAIYQNTQGTYYLLILEWFLRLNRRGKEE